MLGNLPFYSMKGAIRCCLHSLPCTSYGLIKPSVYSSFIYLPAQQTPGSSLAGWLSTYWQWCFLTLMAQTYQYTFLCFKFVLIFAFYQSFSCNLLVFKFWNAVINVSSSGMNFFIWMVVKSQNNTFFACYYENTLAILYIVPVSY